MATTLSACLGWYPQLSTADGSSLSGISCPSSLACFAVGSSSSGTAIVEQTTDAGGQWVTDSNGVTGLGLNAISCADPSHCVAVGGVSLGGIIEPSNSVLVTTDGGTNWEASTISSVDGYLTSVSCPDIEHCWATAAVGIVGKSTVVVTADGGTSWSDLPWRAPPLPDTQSAPMSSQLDAIACTTSSDCLVVGEATYEITNTTQNRGVISTTNDGGQTWQSQLIAANVITGISCPNAHDCVAVGQDPVLGGQDGAFSAYKVVTADGGATWTVSTLASGTQIAGGNNPALNAISCSDTLDCVAVGVAFNSNNKYQTPVMTTSDGGATWSNQAAPIPTGAPLLGVACVTSSACWAVGFTSSGSVIIDTINGGAASPIVTGVSPNQGPGGGGTQVSVTGTGFELGVLNVEFGPVAATDVTVVSDSVLTLTVPPSAGVMPSTGTVVDVTVTTTLGASPPNPSDQFTYLGSTSTPGITLTTTAPGASCNSTNPDTSVCTGLASGDVVGVNGTGFFPGAIASIAQCNSDPRQSVISFLGQYIPVSCSRLVLTNVPVTGPSKGEVSGVQTIEAGTLGPPGTAITPTCIEGTTTIPGCTTSANAGIDAAAYPCPPSPAQQANGDTCVLAVTDTAGGHAGGILLYGQEPSPNT